jgi:hypothetical protein
MPAHPSEDERRTGQQHRRERRREAEGEDEAVQGEGVGDITPAGTEGARDRGRDAAPHAARRRVLDQHDEREGERHACERVRAEPAEEQPVEGDHAGDRQEIEHVGRREPQQRRKDRPFEQQFGARGDRASGGQSD